MFKLFAVRFLVKRTDIGQRQSLLDLRERTERLMRLRLIPIGRGGHIVASVIVMTMLDRYTNAFVKHNGVLYMITVDRYFTAPVRSAPRMMP